MAADPADASRPARLPAAVGIGLWMAVSAICFAGLVGLVRHLSAEMDVFVISFWRNAFAIATILPLLLRAGESGLRTKRHGLFLTRSGFMVASSVALFFSVVLMPVAEATALSFTAPLFSVALAVLVLRESVGPRRWIAMAIGFAGTLIILRPGLAAFDPVALLVLFSSAMFAAVVVTGKILDRTETPARIVAYLNIYSLPLSLIPALFVWQWPTWEQFAWLVVLGLMANGNMYGIARAMRLGDASLAMPFDFLRLPFVALVGYLAFSELPDIWTWVGAAVIFGSAAYIGRREAQAAAGKREER